MNILESAKQKLNDIKVQKSLVIVLAIALGFALYANMFNKYSPEQRVSDVVNYIDAKSKKIASSIPMPEIYKTKEARHSACMEMVNKENFSVKETEILSYYCEKELKHLQSEVKK